jgi:ribonuclease VapC
VIIDSSAIVAVTTGEHDKDGLLRAMARSSWRGVSSATLVETGFVLVSRYSTAGRTALATFCEEFSVQELAFTGAHQKVALDAFQRFGKGRHPAALNFGDCLSYATARVARQPLLCIGNDFVQTDLEVVPLR